MHSQEAELLRYLDGELGSAERMKVETHLAGCSICRARVTELQALAAILQSWILPSGLAQLKQPLSLPARETKTQVNLGIIGWSSGLGLVLLFMMVRAIFWLSSQLNWVARLVETFGFGGWFEQFTTNLWRLVLIHPFYLAYLGEIGQKLRLGLGVMLPFLLYMVSIGVIMILYFNWFSLIFVSRRSDKIRS
ncbi:MAG: zf-HC2 domain-containing protein [Anaerolineae bacterium]|nr:zf-HC2 domain-containing protein [Anaerolineae bacterium]